MYWDSLRLTTRFPLVLPNIIIGLYCLSYASGYPYAHTQNPRKDNVHSWTEPDASTGDAYCPQFAYIHPC